MVVQCCNEGVQGATSEGRGGRRQASAPRFEALELARVGKLSIRPALLKVLQKWAPQFPEFAAPLRRKERGASRVARPPTLRSRRGGFFSRVEALLKPVQHFLFDPPDSRLAQPYPLGE